MAGVSITPLNGVTIRMVLSHEGKYERGMIVPEISIAIELKNPIKFDASRTKSAMEYRNTVIRELNTNPSVILMINPPIFFHPIQNSEMFFIPISGNTIMLTNNTGRPRTMQLASRQESVLEKNIEKRSIGLMISYATFPDLIT